MRRWKGLVSFVAVCTAVGLLGACGGSEDSSSGSADAGKTSVETKALSLSLGFQWQPQWVPLLHGQKKGYFKAENIDVQVQPTTGPLQSLQMQSAGKVDFALTDLSTYVTARARGETDAKIVYVYLPQPTLGLVSLTPFPTPKSLEGAKFGTVGTSSSDQVIKYLLAENGAKADSVNISKLDFAVLYPSLFSKKIDAAEARDPGSWRNLQAQALKQGVPIHFTRMSDWGLAGYGYVVIASEKMIADQPDVVGRMVKAIDQSVRDARENLSNEQVVELLGNEVDVPNPEAAGLDWQDFKSLTANHGPADESVIAAEIELQKRTGQIEQDIDAASTFDNQFVPKRP